jgi:hypothetical protein
MRVEFRIGEFYYTLALTFSIFLASSFLFWRAKILAYSPVASLANVLKNLSTTLPDAL